MKMTTFDSNGNAIGSMEIDGIESIPDESREKIILEWIGYNKAYLAHDAEKHKAQLAHDEKHQEEITTRTRDLQKALSALLSEKLDK